jgi:hypothetical protein
MKSRFCAWLLALPLGLCAQETPEPTLATARDDSYPGETGMHHRVHAWTTTDAAGRQVPHRVVSIATGKHFWDGQAWSPSDARFEVTPEAFAAERMPHKVWLRGNLNVVGSVTVVSPSGEILRSTPVAIALYNAANGESTVIGTIRDCEGVQVSDTEVVFENAFKRGRHSGGRRLYDQPSHVLPRCGGPGPPRPDRVGISDQLLDSDHHRIL